MGKKTRNASRNFVGETKGRPIKRSSAANSSKNYRSGFEKKSAAYLEKRGVPYEYEKLKISYLVPEASHVYTPDFRLSSNGIIVECKGKFDRASRKKMALVIEQHPDLDIRLLFMRDNPINKGSKTKYSDWCKDRGITCHTSANGEVPDDWLA